MTPLRAALSLLVLKNEVSRAILMTKIYQHIRSQLVPAMAKRIVDVCSEVQENDVMVWADSARKMETRQAHLLPLLEAYPTVTYQLAKKLVKGLKEVIDVSVDGYRPGCFVLAQQALEESDFPELGDWVWLSLLQDAIGFDIAQSKIPATRIILEPVERTVEGSRIVVIDWVLRSTTWQPELKVYQEDEMILNDPIKYMNPFHVTGMKRWFKRLCDQQSAALAWMAQGITHHMRTTGPYVQGSPNTVLEYHQLMDLDTFTPSYHA